MIRFEDWKPRIARGTPWLRFLDLVDERVLGHRFYAVCTWLGLHPDWRPTSAAHPRPGRPFYINSECPSCGRPLVLHDRLHADSNLSDDQVWHDEWVCPNCREGIWLDWPASTGRA